MLLLEERCEDDSDVNNGVIIGLATLLVIAVIGLVISIVVIVFFVVQRKRSRCVVTSIIFYIKLYRWEYCCRYDDDGDQQSNVRYSDVKQSVSGDNTIKNYRYANTARPSEPEYEDIEIDHKPDHDVKMDANPAYHATS